IVLNIGGVDVVYAGSEVGRVVAIDAVTGADYAGWATNPVTLDAGQRIGGSASDGVSLYYVTRIGGLNGDVFSIDAATGTINWDLASGAGLQGVVEHTGPSGTGVSEGFTNISYDAGKLFVGSRMTGDFPRDGIYYTLDAASGAVINTIKSNGFLFSNPIVDINLVYCQTIGRWISGNPSVGNAFFAAGKNSGAFAWQSEQVYEVLDNGRFYGQGVLSCEPEPVADIIINTDEEGSINFWHSLTGEQLFRRRMDFGQDNSLGASVTLAADVSGATHVLVSNRFGAVVDLVKGADRPRLEIQDYDPQLPVEFSVAVSEIKTIANALVNTGCADLNINNVNISDVSNGSSDPFIVSTNVVRPALLDRSTDLANNLAAAGSIFKIVLEASIVNDAGELSLISVRELTQNTERFISRSATSAHPYLNSVVSPVSGQVIAAGDSADIILDVNPAAIERGPQIFYIELDTDDPDFYVNAGSAFLPSLFPEIKITLVGGCLIDTTTLEFGAGGANIQLVTNTGRLANGDWSPHGFTIDGESDIYFQGTYFFGVSPERIALSMQDLFSGGGEDDAWRSIQGDPNWCDNTCKPALLTGVTLGSMWDGASYQPISGNMICVSWIDSVQDFSLGGGLAAWNWRNFTAPFDDSLTMGVSATTRTIGALNTPALANLTVEIFDIHERNGNPIPGWKFGSWGDYDIIFVLTGIPDTSLIDQSISTAWCTDANLSSDVAWGQIKLPFGCGYTPLKNAYALDEDQAMFSTASRGATYIDSIYHYMALPAGNHGHFVTGTGDQAQHFTLVEHDFVGNDTISFAIANFGFNSGLATVADGSALAPTAHLVNKWLGFGRGDVDNDNNITVADIMTVVGIVSGSVLGAIPFEHLADVDADGDVDIDDIDYLVDYYFNNGPCPKGDWTL
ncbi:MAG: PQQ-binding-like beta-propeller repeat protein, partial [candidate division Zixibacteria bacterium]|nr:PQQ-binding-like beta-propeller repeat protein [candidate division Zixibacteria bacterium]